MKVREVSPVLKDNEKADVDDDEDKLKIFSTLSTSEEFSPIVKMVWTLSGNVFKIFSWYFYEFYFSFK